MGYVSFQEGCLWSENLFCSWDFHAFTWVRMDKAKMGEDYAMYMKDHAMATVFCSENKRTAGLGESEAIWVV